MKNYSFKFPDDLSALVDAESERLDLGYSDVIRNAVRFYFDKGQERRDLDELLYEVVKTRAVVLRGFDMTADQEFRTEMLDEAGKDAVAYIEERRKQ